MSIANKISQIAMDYLTSVLKFFFYEWEHKDDIGWISNIGDTEEETYGDREAFLEDGEDRKASKIMQFNSEIEEPEQFLEMTYEQYLLEDLYEQE